MRPKWKNGNEALNVQFCQNSVQFYDLFDKVQKMCYYNSTGALQLTKVYVYDSEGILAQQCYLVGSSATPTKSCYYEYDSLGRLIRSREEGPGGVKQQTEHLYDTANRLISQTIDVYGTSFTEGYSYSTADGSLTEANNNRYGKITNQYGGIRRLTRQVYETSDGTKFNREYIYADDASTNQGEARPTKLWYYTGTTSGGTVMAGNTYTYTTDAHIPWRYLINNSREVDFNVEESYLTMAKRLVDKIFMS